MPVELAAVVGRCAPEIFSAALFLVHRKYPDTLGFEDILKRLRLGVDSGSAQKCLMTDLIDFDQIKRDFETALVICISGYCLLIAAKPTRIAGLGVLVWAIGSAIARRCFSFGNSESRYRRRWVLVVLFAIIEVLSVTAKVAMQ